MTTAIPLGKRESQHLEFKGRDSLRNPFSIGREVVAMLNADGGEIWVGIEEQNLLAAAVQTVERPEEARAALTDHLLDTIEPRPTAAELKVEVAAVPQGGAVLRLEVIPNRQRRPYAQRKNDGSFFFQRFDDRVRALSWTDVRAQVEGAGRRSGVRRERRERLGEIAKWKERLQAGDVKCLSMCILPALPVDLRLGQREAEIHSYAWDPSKTGNRRAGWTFADFDTGMTRRISGTIVIGDDVRKTTISNDGRIEFSVHLDALHWKGEPNEIWPYPLMEFPVSVFRLAKQLYDPALNDAEVFADLALIGAHGWKLRPGSTRSRTFQFSHPVEYTADRDLVSDRPLTFTGREVLDEPDRCAIRLVERVYRAFGFNDDELPSEFDRATSRLIFPE